MQKLSWREKYAAILILTIGIIFLLMQIASIASNKATSYASQQEAFIINKNELFSDIRTWLVIMMGVAAGFLLLKNKTLGWVLGLPVLLVSATFLLVIALQHVIQTKKVDGSLTVPGVGLFAMILAIAFLLAKRARQHYRVSNRLVMLTLLIFAGIGSLYYFLQ